MSSFFSSGIVLVDDVCNSVLDDSVDVTIFSVLSAISILMPIVTRYPVVACGS